MRHRQSRDSNGPECIACSDAALWLCIILASTVSLPRDAYVLALLYTGQYYDLVLHHSFGGVNDLDSLSSHCYASRDDTIAKCCHKLSVDAVQRIFNVAFKHLTDRICQGTRRGYA